MVNCLKCGKEIVNRNSIKYCSETCQKRASALKHYNAIKDNPEYKSSRKIYFDNWRKINREKFNALLREPSKRYQRKIKAERKEKGLCPRCGKMLTDNFKHCSDCRRLMRQWALNRHAGNNAAADSSGSNSLVVIAENQNTQ